jgi:CHAD domain-containing protein
MKKVSPAGLRIFKQEPFQENFHRMVLEQLQHALLFCGQFVEKPDFATHEIRKSTKRIRAIYRLYRKATGEEVYRHSNKLYSHLSQSLADIRISAVNVASLQWLAADKRLPVAREFMHGLITDTDKHHQQITLKIIEEQQADRYLTELLTAEMAAIKTKPAIVCDFPDLIPGFRRTYSQGRKNLAQVMLDPATENLHELRKQVKSIWIQFLILRPIYPAYFGVMAHQLDALAQKLGLDHDLAELELHLNKEPSQKSKTATTGLLGFLHKKRQTLQRAAIQLAMRLFIEKPRTLSVKMERFYGLYSGKGV